ncbi:MAG: sigma-70 family RNA polymerase sigma factor [Planctomycetaceae bacterium]|nr:sigma-70 family RNA polymerase sigma factor [Planctomycetaceae bacterium]
MPSTEQDPLSLSPPSDEFVQLFTRTQRRLYLTILSQVPRPDDAEEILQNANVVIWSKCRQFQSGTNFFAWAARIAALEVLKFRQRHARDRLQFSDEFVRTVVDRLEEESPQFDLRKKALTRCLTKLRSDDRKLIQLRYASGSRGKFVAESLGRPANSVYQSLGRIRRSLLECIERQLKSTPETV